MMGCVAICNPVPVLASMIQLPTGPAIGTGADMSGCTCCDHQQPNVYCCGASGTADAGKKQLQNHVFTFRRIVQNQLNDQKQ